MICGARLALAALLSTACTTQRLAETVAFSGGPYDGAATWYRDVLPIVRSHCQGCHRPDGIGPFSMLEHRDAAPWATAMAQLAVDRVMPPWMPSAGCAELADARRLDEASIATLAAWAEQGALAGDPEAAPAGGRPVPRALPSVDLVLEPASDYTTVADPSDVQKLDDYHCFVLPTGLEEDRLVTGFDVVPGVGRQVHHVTLHRASGPAARLADEATPEPGYPCVGTLSFSDGGLGSWVPGSGAVIYPATTGLRLRPSDVVVMQVHYTVANGPPLPDRTRVLVDLADGPVDEARSLTIADRHLAIPAGASGHTTAITLPWPTGGRVLGVTPHVGPRGTGISVEAGGRCLLDIPRWDVHWQQGYFLSAAGGLPLAAGDPVTLRCRFDNPTPGVVRSGTGPDDEVCLAFFFALGP
jgi:hypothetical protein